MAESTIEIELVTPEKTLVKDKAEIVSIPASEGEIGALKGHTPLLTALKVGPFSYKDATGHKKYFFVSGGFAEILPSKITVLAESAESSADIDIKRAEKSLKRAEERLANYKAGVDKAKIDLARAEAALSRAVGRLKISAIR